MYQMTENFKTAAIGVSGIAGTEVIPELVQHTANLSPTANLILQILIGVVTLVKLLKSPKRKKDEQTTNEKLQ